MAESPAHSLLSIDRFLPEKLRRLDNPWHALQARILLFLLAVNIAIFGPVSILMLSVSLLGIMDLWLPTLVALVAVTIQGLCLFYFYRSANLYISRVVYAILALGQVVFATVVTGGWHSPIAIFLLTMPIMIGLVVSAWEGFAFAVLTLAIYSTMFVLHLNGYEFVQMMTEDSTQWWQISLWLSTAATIAGSLFLYNYSANDLSRSVNADKARLEFDANYDSLTGAYNQQAFLDLLNDTLMDPTRVERDALVYIEISNLRHIDLLFGFEITDRVLKEVQQLIRTALGNHEAISRYSENSFLVFCPQIPDIGAFISTLIRLQSIRSQQISTETIDAITFEILVGAAVVEGRVSSDTFVDAAVANAREGDTSLFMRLEE